MERKKRVLLVDNNPVELAELLIYASSHYPEAKLMPYTDPMLAGALAGNEPDCQALICELNMVKINGFELARIFHKLHPQSEITFVTDYRLDNMQEKEIGPVKYISKSGFS